MSAGWPLRLVDGAAQEAVARCHALCELMTNQTPAGDSLEGLCKALRMQGAQSMAGNPQGVISRSVGCLETVGTTVILPRDAKCGDICLAPPKPLESGL